MLVNLSSNAASRILPGGSSDVDRGWITQSGRRMGHFDHWETDTIHLVISSCRVQSGRCNSHDDFTIL